MLSENTMALKTIEKLEKSGFEAYLVGGCVRDMFMNRVCHDIDIATNASPKQVLRVFSSWKTPWFAKISISFKYILSIFLPTLLLI